MLGTLQKQMRIAEQKATAEQERIIHWTQIVMFSVILFGALLICISLFT